MTLFRRIGLKLIDLVLISIALLYITSTAIWSGDLALISLDFVNLLLIVFIAYIACVFLVNILCMTIPTDTFISRIAKTAVSGMLLIFTFPWLLNIIMLLLNYQLMADAQLILFWTAIIRACVRAYMGRRWDQQAV